MVEKSVWSPFVMVPGGEIRVESFCNGGEIQRNPCGVLS